MRVGLDLSQAVRRERTGIGNYSLELARAIASVDRTNEYLLYPVFYIPSRELNLKRVPKAPNFKVAYRAFPYALAPTWTRLCPDVIKEALLGGVDVVHSQTFVAPRLKRKRLVVTVHDLTFMTHPECHKKEIVALCAKGVKDAALYADAVIAISESTRADLINLAGVPEGLIHVTHLAAGPEYYFVEDIETVAAVRRKYGLTERYILFVGSIEPRKNLKALFRAYSMLPENLKREFVVAVAGARGWMNSDIPGALEALGIKERVRFLGFVETEDLSALYSGAELSVYPSLYEGFGLPVLEAMACGTPVIASNTSSIPEVAGSAAILVDPFDTEGLSAAIRRVLEDGEERMRLRGAGLMRSRLFSWERCARETIRIYHKVLNSPKRS